MLRKETKTSKSTTVWFRLSDELGKDIPSAWVTGKRMSVLWGGGWWMGIGTEWLLGKKFPEMRVLHLDCGDVECQVAQHAWLWTLMDCSRLPCPWDSQARRPDGLPCPSREIFLIQGLNLSSMVLALAGGFFCTTTPLRPMMVTWMYIFVKTLNSFY